jgi:uncharacterized protein (DUF2141 family)
MMKKYTWILVLLALGSFPLFAQTLTIKVENINPVQGNLMAGVFNNEKTFPDEYFKGQIIKITGTTMTVTFADLPKGSYAVSVYQDLNENEELDKNIFGVPKEKYGFSNNSSRPDYKKSLFEFTGDLSMTIRLR